MFDGNHRAISLGSPQGQHSPSATVQWDCPKSSHIDAQRDQSARRGISSCVSVRACDTGNFMADTLKTGTQI